MPVQGFSRGILARKENNTRALGRHTQTGTSGDTEGRHEIGPGVSLHQDLDLQNV